MNHEQGPGMLHPVIGDRLIECIDLLPEANAAYWLRYMIALTKGAEPPNRPKSVSPLEALTIGGEQDRIHHSQLARREKLSEAGKKGMENRYRATTPNQVITTPNQVRQDKDEDEDKEEDEELHPSPEVMDEHPRLAARCEAMIEDTSPAQGEGRTTGDAQGQGEGDAQGDPQEISDADFQAMKRIAMSRGGDHVGFAMHVCGLPMNDLDNRRAFGAAARDLGKEEFIKCVEYAWAQMSKVGDIVRPAYLQRICEGRKAGLSWHSCNG